VKPDKQSVRMESSASSVRESKEEDKEVGAQRPADPGSAVQHCPRLRTFHDDARKRKLRGKGQGGYEGLWLRWLCPINVGLVTDAPI
jgi:hypothetical protein